LWQEVEVTFNSGKNAKSSVNILHVAKGDGYFDDVKLVELIPDEDPADKVLAGDPVKGKDIFWNLPIAACKNCHMLKGIGSTVGPPLDGIAARQTEAYIEQSLLEPNAVLAKGYEYLKISPMPPMGLILKPQELADVKAFILSLKEPLKEAK
jgi:mono/diheme cytochrome c family protein